MRNQRLAPILLAGFLLGFPPAASALSVLDFTTEIPNAGVFSYAVAGGSMTGTAIGISTAVSLQSPANSGETLNCTDCVLSFQTGNLIFEDGDSWLFEGGGTSWLKIDGEIPSIGIGTPRSLLDASFSDDVQVFRSPGGFTVEIGIHEGLVDSLLASYFGELILTAEEGGMNLQFQVPDVALDGTFTSSAVFFGNVTATIPEPSTGLLLGFGLAGLLVDRRTKARLKPKPAGSRIVSPRTRKPASAQSG